MQGIFSGRIRRTAWDRRGFRCREKHGDAVIDGDLPEQVQITSEKLKQHGTKAMIFQDASASLNPLVRVGKQLTETILAHQRCTGKEARERAETLLDEVGIQDPGQRMKQYPFELSGGMKQRVAIAIALACNPDLIIADEPTTALDVTVQRQILDLLKKIAEETSYSHRTGQP